MIPTPQLADAVEHALRAPSVHNTQPWRWRIDGTNGVVELYADPNRHLPSTDPERRDLLISCGTELHHLLVALAHAGLQARVLRLPDPEDSTHLATVTVGGADGGGTGGADDPARDALADLFPAIRRRHTDRRRFSHRPVPPGLIRGLVDAAAHAGALLVPVKQPHERFTAVLADAADRQRWTPGYPAELQIWTRRHGGARDGIPPTAIAHPPSGLAGPSGMRHFPNAQLTQPMPPAGHGLPDDAAAFLVLATAADRPEDRLRAGEALSAVLLAATRAGLATTPLSQATEVAATRDMLNHVVGIPEHPQLVVRVGWPATHAAELSETPRRDLTSVLIDGRAPTTPERS
jgi:nitroreductase